MAYDVGKRSRKQQAPFFVCLFVFWPIQMLYTSHNKTVVGYFISILFKSKDHYVFPLAVSTMVLQQNRGNENLCFVL